MRIAFHGSLEKRAVTKCMNVHIDSLSLRRSTPIFMFSTGKIIIMCRRSLWEFFPGSFLSCHENGNKLLWLSINQEFEIDILVRSWVHYGDSEQCTTTVLFEGYKMHFFIHCRLIPRRNRAFFKLRSSYYFMTFWF